MNSDIVNAIKARNRAAATDPKENGGPPIALKDHPNANYEPAELTTWVVTRKVMDKKRGDNGFCRLAIQAPTAPIAARLADRWVEAINAPACGRSPERIPDYVVVL